VLFVRRSFQGDSRNRTEPSRELRITRPWKAVHIPDIYGCMYTREYIHTYKSWSAHHWSTQNVGDCDWWIWREDIQMLFTRRRTFTKQVKKFFSYLPDIKDEFYVRRTICENVDLKPRIWFEFNYVKLENV